MAASAEIAGRDVGLPADRRRRIVIACVREYREGDAGLREREPPRRLVRPPQRERARRSLRRAPRARRVGSCSRSRSPRRAAKTSLRAVEKLTERVDGELRFRSVPPLLVPLRELFDPADARDETEYVRELLDEYAAEPRRRPALPVRDLPVRRHGPQGRRRRQRRHARLDIPARRPRRQGPARAAGEGGAGVGARAVPGRERVRQPRRAGRPRPADLACGHRHLPQLAAQRGPRRQRARLLRPPALGLEGVDRPVDDDRIGPARVHPGLRLVAGARARPLRRPAGDRRLPGRRPEVRPGDRPLLRRRTPTRTSSTTSGWPRPSSAGEVAAETGV